MLDWRQHSLSRRELMGVLALGAVGLSLGSPRAGAIRRLSLVRQETGEATSDVAFWVNGPSAAGVVLEMAGVPLFVLETSRSSCTVDARHRLAERVVEHLEQSGFEPGRSARRSRGTRRHTRTASVAFP